MIIDDLDYLASIADNSNTDNPCLLQGQGIKFTLPKIDLKGMVFAFSLPNPIGTGVDMGILANVAASEFSLLKVFSGVYVKANFSTGNGTGS